MLGGHVSITTPGTILFSLVGLGQLLDTQGRWRELTELISAEIAHAPDDPVARTALLGRLAEIYEFNR